MFMEILIKSNLPNIVEIISPNYLPYTEIYIAFAFSRYNNDIRYAIVVGLLGTTSMEAG